MSKKDKGRHVWVRDPKVAEEEVFLKATFVAENIVSDKETQVTVKYEDGSTHIVNKNLILDCNSAGSEDKKDHCNLEVLNAATLVENTQVRFANDKIYTYISQLLIAVNPFKRIAGLYDDSVKEIYKGSNWAQLDPHVYAIAEMSFQSMTMQNQSQSLLVSGESGAGKTETNKQLMDYLIWRSQSTAGAITEMTPAQQKVAKLAKRILDTNPVLEAFGNAKSIRNNNSSRFGKYINLKFSKEWRVMGAEVRTFLLEKSRVTAASLAKERSYHIFYQLFAGSQKKGQCLDEIHGKRPEDFYYTSLSGTSKVASIDDNEDFAAMHDALENCGFVAAEKTELYQVLGGMLFLGNIKIATDESKDLIEIDPNTVPDLKTAQKLLGITDIQQLLIEKIVKSPRSGTQYHIALDAQKATEQRDALVKHMYHMVFNLIVDKINVQIQVDKDFHRFIGLLDVFGFEVFDTNSFEQLCINFANEKLHNFFLMRVFDVEMELYKMQNLDVPPLVYPDNTKTIELMEKASTGIFPLLDAQCKMPKGSDVNFNAMIVKQHASHPNFSTLSQHPNIKAHRGDAKKTKLGNDEAFVISHFAGDVCYFVENFLTKNTDKLSAQFELPLRSSKNSVMVEMISGIKLSGGAGATKGDVSERARRKSLQAGQLSARGGGGGGGKESKGGGKESKGGSVSKTFLIGLKQLMREIATTHPFFVRCVKPNNDLAPKLFKTAMVLGQMEKSGTIECVKLMQAGYPSRAPYADLKTRFQHALPDFMLQLDPFVFVELLLLACNCQQGDYQLGQDMVFFRSNKGGLLQELMMMRKDLVAQEILRNGVAAGYDKQPNTQHQFKELAAYVEKRKAERAAARKLFEDAVLATIRMANWVKWGTEQQKSRSSAVVVLQAVRRGRAARAYFEKKKRELAEKKAAEAAARKAAEEAEAARKAAEAAEAAEREEAEKRAVEARAAAEKAAAEMAAAEAAAKAAAVEEAAAAEAKRKAEQEAKTRESLRLQTAGIAQAAAEAAEAEDEPEPFDEKWFVDVEGKGQIHRYLMCKGVEWGFQYHNFYGDWELSPNDPTCNGRPHYVHNTMYGGHAHLFHTIDPHYHVPRWVIGPAPGNENGWAFCESDAPSPHDVVATWISWDGFEWHSCKSFRFVPKEHEMDGLSDEEEDFEEADDLWDENQFGSSGAAEAAAETRAEGSKKVEKVSMSLEEYEELKSSRSERKGSGSAAAAREEPKAEPKVEMEAVAEEEAEEEEAAPLEDKTVTSTNIAVSEVEPSSGVESSRNQDSDRGGKKGGKKKKKPFFKKKK